MYESAKVRYYRPGNKLKTSMLQKAFSVIFIHVSLCASRLVSVPSQLVTYVLVGMGLRPNADTE